MLLDLGRSLGFLRFPVDLRRHRHLGHVLVNTQYAGYIMMIRAAIQGIP